MDGSVITAEDLLEAMREAVRYLEENERPADPRWGLTEAEWDRFEARGENMRNYFKIPSRIPNG